MTCLAVALLAAAGLGCSGTPAQGTDRGDAGVPAQDAGDGSRVVDVCEEVSCSDGTCIDSLGEAICQCEGNRVGANCDRCALGYALPDCESCAIGYLPDATGACLENACGGVTCSDRGACQLDDEGQPFCVCRVGVDGNNCQRCAAGYVGDDCDQCDTGYGLDDGACVPEACVGNDCSGHGTCGVDGGDAQCACDEGYTGADCSDCDDGYVAAGGGACIVSVCDGVECGAGECVWLTGDALCACPEGFGDAACTECASGYTLSEDGLVCDLTLPAIDSAQLVAWYDASNVPLLVFGEPGRVVKVRNSYQPEVNRSLWAQMEEREPTYALFDRAVRFDGAENYFYSYVDHAGLGDYTLYFVIKWDAAKKQWLFRTHSQDDDPVDNSMGHGLTIQILEDNRVRVEHRSDYGATTGDVVVGDFFSHGEKQLVKVSRRPFLNGHVLLVSDGSETAQVEAAEAGFDRIGLATFGCNHSEYSGELFDGDLHEVVTIHGVPNAEEEQAIEDYLRAKWELD
jgi:hypothetical protein